LPCRCPVAIIFFWVLWALGRFRYLRPTSAGIAVAGCVCGFYPAVCGLFPVFWFRWELAFPVAAIQFVFLALIVALFAWLDRAFGAVAYYNRTKKYLEIPLRCSG